MKKHFGILKIVIIFIIVLIIGYVIGCLLPLPFIIKHFVLNSITANIVINSILAFLSFLTIVTALFKEDILQAFHPVHIKMTKAGKNFFLEDKPNKTSENPFVDAYEMRLKVINTGNYPGQDFCIRIDDIEYMQTSGVSKKIDSVHHKRIKINLEESQYLQAGSYFEFSLLRITPVNFESEVNSGKSDDNRKELKNTLGEAESAILSIIDCEIPEDCHNGCIKINISITCREIKELRYQLSMKWNGKWHGRLTDMENDGLSVDLVEL
ncbi:MAG: hypothetical protein SOZ96_08120 [Treponema sp.]|nr:hypothetical protein [Treponema sp.]